MFPTLSKALMEALMDHLRTMLVDPIHGAAFADHTRTGLHLDEAGRAAHDAAFLVQHCRQMGPQMGWHHFTDMVSWRRRHGAELAAQFAAGQEVAAG